MYQPHTHVPPYMEYAGNLSILFVFPSHLSSLSRSHLSSLITPHLPLLLLLLLFFSFLFFSCRSLPLLPLLPLFPIIPFIPSLILLAQYSIHLSRLSHPIFQDSTIASLERPHLRHCTQTSTHQQPTISFKNIYPCFEEKHKFPEPVSVHNIKSKAGQRPQPACVSLASLSQPDISRGKQGPARFVVLVV